MGPNDTPAAQLGARKGAHGAEHPPGLVPTNLHDSSEICTLLRQKAEINQGHLGPRFMLGSRGWLGKRPDKAEILALPLQPKDPNKSLNPTILSSPTSTSLQR